MEYGEWGVAVELSVMVGSGVRGGLMVALLAPSPVPRLVTCFGVTRVILTGLCASVVAYALFLLIGLESNYPNAMLPSVILGGLAFSLAYGPLNIAATNGIAPDEQGLAGGLVNTSFQFGGALVLAAVTAVNNASAGPSGSPQALLDGFHSALIVPLVAAMLGVGVTALGLRRPARSTSDQGVPAVGDPTSDRIEFPDAA